MDLIQAGVSMLSGGLAGAVVNALITARKQKLEITLSVIKDFFALYVDIGRAKGVFAEMDIRSTLSNQNNLLLVRRIGDWFHYVASLTNEGAVDISLLRKVGITKEIKSFSESIAAAKSRCPEHLENAWEWWGNLENFKQD